MIRRCFTTGVKHLTKTKLPSLVNVIGLAFGLAASIIIFLYVQGEWSYDKQWVNADGIYKLMRTEEGTPEIDTRISGSMFPVFANYFASEIERAAVLQKAAFAEVMADSNSFVADVDFVNEDFLSVFQFDTLSGSLDAIFSNPNALAVSEEAARQWFGKTNVVGERISVRRFFAETGTDYDIVAVYRQASGNSTLAVKVMGGYSGETSGFYPEVYLTLAPGVDPKAVRGRLPEFVERNIDRSEFQLDSGQAVSDVFQYHLINVDDLYFHPIYCAAWNAAPCGSRYVVAGFAVIAVLVLLTACVNYVALALAKAGQRAREVAMRKISGAVTANLVVQFLGESIVVLVAALLLALALVDVFLPLFAMLADIRSSLDFGLPGTYFALFALLAVVALVTGLYPSIYISRFHPVRALKGNQSFRPKGFSRLYGTLLVFQFSSAIGLLIATFIVFGQLFYMQRLDPGFNPENLVQIAVGGQPEVTARAGALNQDVLGLPQVGDAALTGMDPGENGVVVVDEYRANGLPEPEVRTIPTIPVGFDFFETLQMPVLAGRSFEQGRDQPETTPPSSGVPDRQDRVREASVVLNEAAVRLLGFPSRREALNQTLSGGEIGSESGEIRFTIIGIVSDSQYRSLEREAGPEVFRLNPDSAFFLMVRFGGDSKALLSDLEAVWRKVQGDAVFQSSFVMDNLAAVFQEERNQGILMVTFAFLAILISCLGLYGVTAFTIDRRTREIGIRKVMGAEVSQLVWLFCWQFSRPVLLANLVAWPIALWAMLTWLQRFPYQIDTLLLIPLCVLAGAIALSIAWLTVAGNTVKVATANPVYALRYE